MSSIPGNNLSGDDRTKQDTSEEKEKVGKQKNRTGRIRKFNTWMLILSIAVLMALCASLVARIYALNGTIGDLTAQVDELSRKAAEQQALLERLQEAQAAAGKEDIAGGSDEEGEGTGDRNETAENEDGTDGDKEQGDAPESTAAHKVYLTFDDGPSIYTQDILDILEEYDVKATFFVVGRESDSARESMKKIVEAGHTLAIHSYTHEYSKVYASVESFAEDFAKLQEYIYDVTGVKSTIYRFPGGSSNTVSKQDMREFAEYLDSQGVTYYDWNISSGDGGKALLSVETLLENCTSMIGRYSTSIILMHDSAGKKTTVEALPEIIEAILAMDDTEILPITEGTKPVQHKKWDFDEESASEEGSREEGREEEKEGV